MFYALTKSINYKLEYSRNLHNFTESGNYFTTDTSGNSNFILFSSLIKSLENISGNIGINFENDFEVELNYQQNKKKNKTINYTQSNSVNNFGTINNIKENTDFSNLIFKYKQFELGYQLDGDTNFNSNKVFIGVNFNSNSSTLLTPLNEVSKNWGFGSINIDTSVIINSEGQSIINFSGLASDLIIRDNLSFDFSYYLGDYLPEDTLSLRTKSKLKYNIFNYKGIQLNAIELNYLTFKNTSINNLSYLTSGVQFDQNNVF